MAQESQNKGDTSDAKENMSSHDDDDDETIDGDNVESEVESDDDDAEDEPKLKYARLTSHLGPIYRNGDATSAFLVAGDKMVGFRRFWYTLVLITLVYWNA